MAHQRTASTAAADALKEPHSVSLKVLRLSRPTLTPQHPLPSSFSSSLAQSINPSASHAYPTPSTTPAPSPLQQSAGDAFILTPLLTLPPAFGNAYVGETFSCTLCANNEILEGAGDKRSISGVRIEAEMKTPGGVVSLGVKFASDEEGADDGGRERGDLDPGQSMQGVVEFHLKEEGNHVLAVTVSYTETGAMSGRVRSFRKLYQFVARGCLVVRTKIGALPEGVIRLGDGTVGKRKRWALEAQLENCGEEIIVLDLVTLNEKPWCRATGLNWDVEREGEKDNPILGPGDVQQVCFLVEEAGIDGAEEVDGTGRLVMGMLNIGWRGAMGNRGSLSTGWLGTRLR